MDTHQIVTPENVELNYEIAGIGSRFLALFIDSLIQGFIFLAIVWAAALLELNKIIQLIIPGLTRGIAFSAMMIIAVIITFGYHIILETMMNGQTIGKKIMHIRVRKEQGRLTFWDVLLRNFIRFIDSFPFYITGLVVMFLNKKAKRLGDLAAGTVVVREMPRKKLAQFLAANKVPVSNVNQEGISVKNLWIQSVLSSISQKDYFLMKNIYSRRYELSNFNDLAAKIIQKIITKASLPEYPSFYPSEIEAIMAEMIELYENTFT